MIFQHTLLKSLQTHSSNTAIEQGAYSITYANLLNNASKITRVLLQQNLPRETFIGILLTDRPAFITSMIGIAQAGHVFVPIDGTLPVNRLSEMLDQLQLEWLIVSKEQAPLKAITDRAQLQLVYFEEVMKEDASDAGTIQYPVYEENDSLYVYFTSGSTGKPKGIVGKNSSLQQFLQWEQSTFGINETHRFSQFISPYFDAFLRDVFVPLLSGGTVCIPPSAEDFFTPEKMVNWIDTNRITLIHCVPSVFRIFNHEDVTAQHFQQLQYVLLSGEKIHPAELAHWYELFGKRIQLVNLYGATETTMIRAWYAIQPEDIGRERIPIGQPISDTELRIVDNKLEACPTLVTGDLYILSAYTSKGYLQEPDLTKDKFIHLPNTPADVVAFKTGDRARKLIDGNIDLIGRTDRQLKIRGIRIEPEEIENCLLRSGKISRVIVLQQSDASMNEWLTAFVVANPMDISGTDLSNDLLQYLQDHLPAYMTPAGIVVMHAFPLLSNGKIDYQALLHHQPPQPVVAPANATETVLLQIWKEILPGKPISITDSFHSLGGSSISMMRLIGKIYSTFNVRISLDELFNNLTIRQQAALIDHAKKDHLLHINPAPVKQLYPLSVAQERLYYYYELNKSTTTFNLPMAWTIEGTFDKQKIEGTIHQLINRHESLRTAIRFVDGRLGQVIDATAVCTIEEVNARGRDLRAVIAELIQPFDLSVAPLIRATIIHGGGEEKVLLIDLHHIVCDGMSQLILLHDFIRLYNGEALPPLKVQYKDYATWEMNYRLTDDYHAHREFWLKSFEGPLPVLKLPSTQGNKKKLTDEGGTYAFQLPKTAIQSYLDLLQSEGITVFSGMFAAWYLFLSQISGEEDLVVGINTSGRLQEELEGVAGMFVKTLPVRYKLPMHASLKEMVRAVHQLLVQVNSRQIYDLADILGELNKRGNPTTHSLFDVMFVYLNFGNEAAANASAPFSKYEFENTTSKYPLTLFAGEDAEHFYFRMEYATLYFTGADIAALMEQFIALLQRIAGQPSQKIIDYLDGSATAARVHEDEIVFNFQ